MKKSFILIVIVLLILSCGKSGLSTVSKDYITNVNTLGKLEIKPELLSYSISEFDIYVYNICEITANEIDNYRFCNCPEDFFDNPEIKDLKKVEEVYILKHKISDLVLYLTTFSHKYIKEDKGFLNNSEYYKDKIILDQIEYVYIGRFNSKNNWIHFPNSKNNEDIILHYLPNDFPEKLTFLKANISTSENRYTIYEPIDLGSVFKDTLTYKLSPNYSMDFYKNNSRIGKEEAKTIKTIHIISRKGKTELVFAPENPNERLYKISSKRIKYKPNFVLIEN
ncbi:hypothetical protein [Lacinutrix salivirga]